jgi:hypothetical protein
LDLVVEEVEILTAVGRREDFDRDTCPIGEVELKPEKSIIKSSLVVDR